MCGDSFGCHNQFVCVGCLQASSGQRPRLLQNILQCTRQPQTAKNYLTPNVNNTEVEKPALHNVPWERLLIFRRSMPETLSSEALHPVTWLGTPHNTLQHAQQFWSGHTTTPNSHSGHTCSLPIHSRLEALPYSPLRNYWPLSHFSQLSSPFAPTLPATAPVLAALSSGVHMAMCTLNQSPFSADPTKILLHQSFPLCMSPSAEPLSLSLSLYIYTGLCVLQTNLKFP